MLSLLEASARPSYEAHTIPKNGFYPFLEPTTQIPALTSSALLEKAQPPEFEPGACIDITGYWHLDLDWTTPDSVGYELARSTTRSLLHLLDANPDFTSVYPQVAVLKYLEKSAPHLAERVVDYMKQGRLEPVSGSLVQPDESVPSGEALIRQLYEGKEYILKTVGIETDTAWSTDVFGHPADLARIYNAVGLKNLVFKRGERHQVILPEDIFYLAAADGSMVLAERLHEYGTWGDGLPRQILRVAEDTRPPFMRKLAVAGVGDHGGGMTQRKIETVRAMDHHPDWPKVKFTRVSDHFQAIRKEVPQEEIPIYAGSLEYPNGCWSSNAVLKGQFRHAEQGLITAEALAAAYTATSDKPEKAYYPGFDIHHAWQAISEEEEHDTICGTSRPEAAAKSIATLKGVSATAETIKVIATHSMAEQIDTKEEDLRSVNLIVFNSTGHRMRQLVIPMIEQSDPEYSFGDYTKSHFLYDAKGKRIPMQNIPAGTQPANRPGFIAEGDPGLTTYTLRPKPEGLTEPLDAQKIARKVIVENEKGEKELRYRLENGSHQWDFESKTGALVRVYDTAHDFEVFSGPAAFPILYEDKSNAWGADRYDVPVKDAAFIPTSIKLVHDGPVMSAFEIKHILTRNGQQTSTTMRQEFRLSNGLPTLTVNAEINFNERDVAVLIPFPIHVKNYPEVRYESPYAFALRPTDGYQMAAQKWVNIEGEAGYNRPAKEGGRRVWHNVTVANDGKYGFLSTYDHDQKETRLRMIIARGNPYTYVSGEEHNPGFEPQKDLDNADSQLDSGGCYEEVQDCILEKNDSDVMDQGIHTFSYSITPAFGGWRAAHPHRRGDELNRPLVVQQESSHSGTKERTQRFVDIGRDNIGLGAMMRHPSGLGTIVRFVEEHRQKESNVPITVFERQFVRDFRPLQIRSFLIPDDPTIPVIDVDGLGHPIIHNIENVGQEIPIGNNGHSPNGHTSLNGHHIDKGLQRY